MNRPYGVSSVCCVGAGLVPARLSDMRPCRRAIRDSSLRGTPSVTALAEDAPRHTQGPQRGRQGRAAQSPPRLEGGDRAKRGRGDLGANEENVAGDLGAKKTYPPVTLAPLGRQPPLGKGAKAGRPQGSPLRGDVDLRRRGPATGSSAVRLSNTRSCRRAAKGRPYGETPSVTGAGAGDTSLREGGNARRRDDHWSSVCRAWAQFGGRAMLVPTGNSLRHGACVRRAATHPRPSKREARARGAKPPSPRGG